MALKYLRDNLKSLTWVLWLVVAVFILLVFFEWTGFNQQPMASNQVAATVGGEKITYDEFRRAYRNLEDRYRQTFGERFNRDMAAQLNLPVQALDGLINQRILLLEAKKLGIEATDAEVRAAIRELFQDENGRFVGVEDYRRILRNARLSVDEFEDSMRDDVLAAKLNDVLAGAIYVTDAEVERSYRDQNEQATIRYVHLRPDQIDEVAVDDEEVAAYFEANRADYELPEQRVIDYLLVDTIGLQQQLEIPEAELRAYYDSNPDTFTREERVRARHILMRVTPDRPAEQAEQALLEIRRRIESGEDFAALAREVSEDDGSGARGGDLGYFGRNRMVKPFEDAAFSAPLNQVVGPIRSEHGFHLIQVLDRQEGGLQPFETAKNVARARLLSERVQEIAEAKAQDLRNRIQSGSEDVETQMRQLAEEEDVTLTTSEPFGVDGEITGLGRVPAVSRAAFELLPGAVSEPIRVPRGWAIVRLDEIVPPRLPELVEVEDEVRRAVETEAKRARALERLREMRNALGSEITAETFAEAAAERGLEVEDSASFGRQGNLPGLEPDREVIETALELGEGELGGPLATDDGAVLFVVTERVRFDPETFAAEKDAVRERLTFERLNEFRASLIAERRNELAPQYDKQVFENFGIEPPQQG